MISLMFDHIFICRSELTTPHTTARTTKRTTTTTTTTTTAAPVVEEYDYHYYDFSSSNSVDTPHHTGHSFNQQDPPSSSPSADYSYDPGNSLDEDYTYTEYSEYPEEDQEIDQGINTLTGCPGLIQFVANTGINEPNRKHMIGSNL